MIETLFAFGDRDLAAHVMVTDVTRQVVPTRRFNRTTVPGMDGELVSPNGLEAMEVTVSGIILGYEMEEVARMRREIASMLLADRPQALRLPDEPGTYLMAYYEGGTEPSRLMQCPDVEFKFLCPDPVAFGEARAVSFSGSRHVSVGGTYRAWPVVTAKPASGPSWKITNEATGEFVLVRASFTGAQTVVLDMRSGRCTVNGTDHDVDLSSDFFGIEGDVDLSISNGTATISWDERWV